MARRTARSIWKTEAELHAQGQVHVAGVDEVGRGPLAGPVVAAAVILPPRCRLPGLADSKALTPEQRERLDTLIRRKAVALGLGIVDSQTIDAINIRQATLTAMRLALSQLDPAPYAVLTDGLDLPAPCLPGEAIVDGDATCACIAAASIIAKVARDGMMAELDARYPGYGFAQHKGYGTEEHLAQLRALGPCPEHRMSFAPVREVFQQRLPFGEREACAPTPVGRTCGVE
jgi:ribonuclease HII